MGDILAEALCALAVQGLGPIGWLGLTTGLTVATIVLLAIEILREGALRRHWLSALLCLAALVLHNWLFPDPISVAALALWWWFLPSRPASDSSRRVPVLRALLAVGAVRLALDYFPTFRLPLDQGVRAFSGFVSGGLALLGPSAAGMWSFVFAQLLMWQDTRGRIQHRMALGLLLMAVWPLYLAVSAIYHPAVAPAATQFLVQGGLALVLWALSRGASLVESAMAKLRGIGRAKLGRVAAGFAIVGCLVAAGPHSYARNGAADSMPTVAIRTGGLTDWVTPSFEAFGFKRTGMFGALPLYLLDAGFDCRLVPAFSSDTKADVYVIINPTASLPEAEVAEVWERVRHGAGLLVLGDHTDIGGMMSPLNNLLAPVGIGFRFDSAISVVPGWSRCYWPLAHPLARGLDRHLLRNTDLQYGTGASLNVKWPAAPVLVAPFAFSDAGDRSNSGAGAYLGDKAYAKGEPLGDVYLVAEARYGQGRVLVFGDTSSFQNHVLPYSYPYVVRIFGYLANPAEAARAFAGTRVIGGALIGLLMSALAFARRPRIALPIVGLAVFLALVTNLWSARDRYPTPEGLAAISYAHSERFSLEPFQDDSVQGIAFTLLRLGYRPLITHSEEILKQAEVALYVAPQSLSPGDIDEVKDAVAAGQTCIISAGYEDVLRVRGTLRDLGLELVPEPLGPAPDDWDVTGPTSLRFVSAWPVASRAGELIWETVHDYAGKPVVVQAQYGQGRFIFVSDSRFFWDNNIEGEDQFRLGNITFVRSLVGARGQ